MNPSLLGMNWVHYLLAAAIVFVCMLLVVIILLQKGRGGGLSGAFGGGGGSGSAFGAKTGDVFTWITVAFVCLYFLLNIAGNYQFRQVVTPAGLPAIGPLATQPGADGSRDAADPPAEAKSDDQAGGNPSDSPQPKPDSP